MPGANGFIAMNPTVISFTGTSAAIRANGVVDFKDVQTLSVNGVFTASYDNYIVYIFGGVSGSFDVRWRLRASSADSTTGYTYQYLYANSTSITAGRSTTSYFSISYGGNGSLGGMTSYVFGPALAQPTVHVASGSPVWAASPTIYDWGETHSASTAYDGLTLFPDSTTMSGMLRIYAFNQ